MLLYTSVYCSLLDPGTNTEIASYKIHRILFCARGPAEGSERNCFAFTCSHGDSAETAIFQCHVFRCEDEGTVRFITLLTEFYFQVYLQLMPTLYY